MRTASRSYGCLTYLSLVAFMATAARLITTVSTKGQVILPKAIRRRRNWEGGTRLAVEDTPDGVLLKTAPLFAPTQLENVYGSLAYAGPPKTLEARPAIGEFDPSSP